MKRIALVLIAIFVLATVVMAGDMAKSGQWGIQTALGVSSAVSNSGSNNPFPSNTSLGLKFWASDNMAVRVEVGYASTSVAGNSSSSYGLGAGFEYHMESKGGSVSPYVGLEAGYYGGSIPNGSDLPSWFVVNGVFGGEYFFSNAFSWAGEVGIGFMSQSNAMQNATGGWESASSFGTTSATMIFSWYVN